MFGINATYRAFTLGVHREISCINYRYKNITQLHEVRAHAKQIYKQQELGQMMSSGQTLITANLEEEVHSNVTHLRE